MRTILATCLILAPAPLLAQEAGPLISTGEGESSDDELSLNVSFAPIFGSDLVAERGERLNDAVAASAAGIQYKINKNSPVTLVLNAGAKWVSDFEDDDDDSSSALLVGAKVSWNRGCRTINPFASYGFENGYSSFFEAETSNRGTIAAGADIVLFDRKLCTSGLSDAEVKKRSSFTLTITPSVERIESNNELFERWAGRLKLAGSKNVVEGLKAKFSFDYQMRDFDLVESGSDRQHYFNGSAALDFAGLVFGSETDVDTLSLGVSWEVVDQENTGILQDQSEISFTPKISITKKL